MVNGFPVIIPTPPQYRPPPQAEFRVLDIFGMAQAIHLESVPMPGYFLSFHQNGARADGVEFMKNERVAHFEVILVSKTMLSLILRQQQNHPIVRLLLNCWRILGIFQTTRQQCRYLKTWSKISFQEAVGRREKKECFCHRIEENQVKKNCHSFDIFQVSEGNNVPAEGYKSPSGGDYEATPPPYEAATRSRPEPTRFEPVLSELSYPPLSRSGSSIPEPPRSESSKPGSPQRRS